MLASLMAMTMRTTATVPSKIRHRNGELNQTFSFGANHTRLLNQKIEATIAPAVPRYQDTREG